MAVYLDLVILLNFTVDFFLLLGTNRLAGFPLGPGRAATAALLGGLYGGVCLLPGFRFLGNTLWRIVSLGLMGAIAFGIDRSTLRRCALFVLLSMALGGVAVGLGGGGLTVLGATAGLTVLCAIGFQRIPISCRCVPVRLTHQGKVLNLFALHDTGNTLRDPLTGEPILVAGRRIAWELAGLTPKELEDPLLTMTRYPGLRLIPYRSVGKAQGMMLGLLVRQAQINKRERSILVAFAPEGLEEQGEYEALIGGEV